MSKIVLVTREYDDDGKLLCETKTTKVVKEVEEERSVPFGFALPARGLPPRSEL